MCEISMTHDLSPKQQCPRNAERKREREREGELPGFFGLVIQLKQRFLQAKDRYDLRDPLAFAKFLESADVKLVRAGSCPQL